LVKKSTPAVVFRDYTTAGAKYFFRSEWEGRGQDLKMQMPARGKAELPTGAGSITIDYGRPELKGRDPIGPEMLSKLLPGAIWRMGNNQATILNTPVDLTFGSTKIAKGAYSLFLKVATPGKYELVFNSQTGQWGLQHDASKDIAAIPMKEDKLSSPVEKFTLDLKSAPGGGLITLSWGTMILSSEFKTAQ